MFDEAVRWLTLVCGATGVALIGVAWTTRPRGERRLCPGYAPAARGWADPRRALLRYRCGYDLTGVPREPDRVRCPECGRVRDPRELLRPGRRLRIGVIGFVLVGLFCVGIGVPWGQKGRWSAGLPTLVLIALDGPGHHGPHAVVRRELDKRVEAGTVQGMSAKLLVSRLVRGLRDDDHRGNARRAISNLRTLWPASRPKLEAMLTHEDRQTRVLAASLLREKSAGAPSAALLAVCIEDLGIAPQDLDADVRRYKCSAAARFLLDHASMAARELQGAMQSEDPQRRLLAAAIAGFARQTRLMDIAAPILIEHLADNDVRGDAKLASAALYAFGPAVRPLLESSVDDAPDDQQRATLLAILDRLANPDTAAWRLQRQMPRITTAVSDPLKQLTLGRCVRDLRFRRSP